MDYEKAYKEALERARMINNGEDVDVEAGTTTCEYIFPELAESEDEKIRKMLIDSFTRADMGGEIYGKGVTYKQVIAWLEKQGQKPYGQRTECLDCQFNYAGECKGSCAIKRSERKPADKIEPFDEFAGLTDFERTLANICIGWIGKEIGWEQYIKDNADILLKIAIEKFNSVQDTPFEQKDAWSEEDELMLLSTIQSLETTNGAAQMKIDWLKNIKQRIGG